MFGARVLFREISVPVESQKLVESSYRKIASMRGRFEPDFFSMVEAGYITRCNSAETTSN